MVQRVQPRQRLRQAGRGYTHRMACSSDLLIRSSIVLNAHNGRMLTIRTAAAPRMFYDEVKGEDGRSAGLTNSPLPAATASLLDGLPQVAPAMPQECAHHVHPLGLRLIKQGSEPFPV
jgi:hypothetical protein